MRFVADTMYVNCPCCVNGFDGYDEQGMPYTCYACGQTGSMTQRQYDDYMFGINEDPEYVRLQPREYISWDSRDYDPEPIYKTRKFFPWAKPQQQHHVAVDLDDFPF
jgi:hypothetical protein